MGDRDEVRRRRVARGAGVVRSALDVAVDPDHVQSRAAERDEAFDGICAGPEWRGTRHERRLEFLLAVVEQGEHEAGAAAEAAENRAFTDACGRGDVVHGDRVDAAFGDQHERQRRAGVDDCGPRRPARVWRSSPAVTRFQATGSE